MAKKTYFTFVGKIRPLKENGYTEKTDKEWTLKQLTFQAICGNNVHYLKTKQFLFNTESKNTIRTILVDGPETKNVEIAWADRNKPELVEKVVGYRAFVVDTDTAETRKALEEAQDFDALEKSKSKYKKFMSNADFIDYVVKVLSNEKSKDMIFKIEGTVEFSYSAEKKQYYRDFVPTKITRVANDAEQYSHMNFKFFYDQNAIDESFVEDTGDVLLNVYTQYRDTQVKNDAFAPVQLRINATEPSTKYIIDQMKSTPKKDVEVREYGLIVDCVNGSQQVEFNEEMLSDEQKAGIAAGAFTFEEVKASYANGVQGDRITENRALKIMKTYISSSVVDTTFTPEDLTAPPAPKPEEKTSESESQTTQKPKTSTAKAAKIFEDDEI